MSYQDLKKKVEAKGYVFFDKGDYNLNIVGIRNAGNKVTNAFDDVICVAYRENGVEKFKSWPCTTEPGLKPLKNTTRKDGVAILVPGQYRGTHEIRKHQGKYDAVCQKSTAILKVWRDADKNNSYNYDSTIFTNAGGINIHKAGANSTYVDGWSEGCTVFKKEADFNEFMVIANKAKDKWGNSFTYTLLQY